jgi:hypothetical protein
MSKEIKKAQSELTLKAKSLTAEHFSTDASGNLTVKNADLSKLIEENVEQGVRGHSPDASVSVGVVVSVGF